MKISWYNKTLRIKPSIEYHTNPFGNPVFTITWLRKCIVLVIENIVLHNKKWILTYKDVELMKSMYTYDYTTGKIKRDKVVIK